jgi:chemotaxis protein MotB
MTLTDTAPDDEIQVWPSYTDVALNVVLILLMYLFAQAVVASQTSAALLLIHQRQTDLRNEITAALPEDLRTFVSVVADGNLLRVTFADRVLFDRGSADLRAQGQRLLGLVGGVLHQRVESFTQVQVEGHTDDLPISTPQFRSNWELSSARATSVVRFLQDRSAIAPDKLSATGYAEYHPIDPTPTEDGRAKNRRIAMVIVYSVHRAAPATR